MSETVVTFSGIRSDAPLFMKAPLADLLNILNLLSSVSYHYADDSGKKWSLAAERKREAAKVINTLGLGYSAVKAIYGEKPQLITFEDVIDACLREARK